MRLLAFLFLPLAAGLFSETDLPQTAAARPGEPAANILFRSADGGRTWQDVSAGLPAGLAVNSILVHNGEVFLGTGNGSVYHSDDPEAGVWEGGNVGEIFLNNGSDFWGELVTGLFPGSSGPYACLYENGFYRKIPGTNLWQPMHEALADKRVHTVVEKPDGTILTGGPGGIHASSDDGKTWRHVWAGGAANSLTAMGDVMVCGGSRGLLRSTDGGEHWECALTDEGGVYQTCVIEPHNPIPVFAAVRVAGPWRTSAGDNPRRTFTSADGGKTWQRLDAGLPDADLSPVQGMYDLQRAGEFLFCSHAAGISCSTDGGLTWEPVHPATVAGEKVRFRLAVAGRTVYALVVRGGC